MGFSIFFDFGEGYPNQFGARNVLLFGIIILFFELLSVCLDIKLALVGFRIESDLSFRLQSISVPVIALTISITVWAFLNIGWWEITTLIFFLALSKLSILYVQAKVDENRIPEYLAPVELNDI